MIEPGDFILGDIDGILVIPKNLATEVVERTLVVTGKEDIVRARLQEGGDIRELFEQYKVF